MINPAVLIYSFLLRVSRYSKVDAIVYGVLAIIWLVLPARETSTQGVGLLFTSPTLIMLIAYASSNEGTYKRKNFDDGEYMALLFCRPITRASYVFTKWISASLAVLWFVAVNLTLYSVIRLLRGEFTFPITNVYEGINLVVNAFSFSAMMVFVRSIPLKVAVWMFLFLFYTSMFITAGIGSYDTVDNAGQYSEIWHYVREALGTVVSQLIFPAIDIETALTTTRFSWLPFITYISNISIYLLLATVILCRREFSYSYD